MPVVGGSIVAMAAAVTVVAGLATVATKKVHEMFSGGTPKQKRLDTLLSEWRAALAERNDGLVTLRDHELDLLALQPELDGKWLRAKFRTTGTVQSIYAEDVAVFIDQTFPKAKEPMRLLLVRTAGYELVFRTKGTTTFVSMDGRPFGRIVEGVLTLESIRGEAELIAQRDGKTIHLDSEGRTLAILMQPDTHRQVVPRAYEFVDLEQPSDRLLVDTLTYWHILSTLPT